MNWLSNSELFEMARRGKRLTHVAAVIPLTVVFVILSQLGTLPINFAEGRFFGFSESDVRMNDVSPVQSGLWMSMQLIFAFALLYIILWLWLKLYENRPFWTLGFEIKNAVPQYARGVLFGALLSAGMVGILAMFGAVTIQQDNPSQQGFAALGGVLIVLVGWLVQGGAEEALIRGWILPVTGARYRPWIGLLVSAAMFTLLHGLNPGISLLALLNLVLFGIFTGLYAMREGSIWGVSAFHSVVNWMEGNFFGFEVSGNSARGGTLINLTVTKPDWVTGGAFGPEGGFAVTLLLLIGILVILFWKYGKSDSITILS